MEECFYPFKDSIDAAKLLKHKLHLDDLFDERSKARLSCHVSDAFMSILTNMMRWLYDGCERISVTQRSMLCVCNEGITILLENKMLVSVPKRVLHTRVFSDLPIIANIIMFESFRPLVFQNKILGGLYEIFKGDVESMEHVDLTSFSDEGIVEIVFMLRFLIIGKKEIDSNNYSKKLKTFKEMLLKYDLPCSLLFDMFGNLESDYSIKSTDVSMYETMKEKMPSIFTSLETIFTCITWEERGYISRSLHEHCDRYTKEKISKTMKQLSDKVIDLFRNSPKEYTDCWKFRQTIWILVSINTVKKLK